MLLKVTDVNSVPRQLKKVTFQMTPCISSDFNHPYRNWVIRLCFLKFFVSEDIYSCKSKPKMRAIVVFKCILLL